jgi:hypothetical protein
VLLVVSGLLTGFMAGVVSSKTLFATSLNDGLLNAFSSVGQNLLGEGAFGASAIPGNPIDQTLFNSDHNVQLNYGSIAGNPVVSAVCPAQAPSD